VEARVTGSSRRAENRTLTFMASGLCADFERMWQLFHALGKVIVRAGCLGNGQMVKLINNAVAAVNEATVGQALIGCPGSGILRQTKESRGFFHREAYPL
jgi:3-hydroxyisobutyrate dehydrogenase-like beta-hydroxyacid dehydrogenase